MKLKPFITGLICAALYACAAQPVPAHVRNHETKITSNQVTQAPITTPRNLTQQA